MKNVIQTSLTTLFGILLIAGPVAGEEYLVETEERAQPALTPVELTEAKNTVELYVYGKPPGTDSFRLFDRSTSEEVTLTLEEVYTDDIRVLENDHYALDARFSSEDGVRYVLSFAFGEDTSTEDVLYFGRHVESEPIERFEIKAVTIRQRGDQTVYEWVESGGKWELQAVE